MASPLDHVAALVAFWHADGVFRRFQRGLSRVRPLQTRALQATLRLVANSDFGRRYGLGRVRTIDDFRAAVPIQTYEDMRPTIDRLQDGDTTALFRRGQQILMFATSSGTTAAQKLVPVTPEFVREYRRGWNTFGLKMLTDHRDAVLRAILQSSGRHDERYTPAGIPCGAITGLLAQMQKKIVRRYYVGSPEITAVSPPPARYYTLMRFAVERDVAFAITANPGTLIQLARQVEENSETLIRDLHDGTLSPAIVPDAAVRAPLTARLKPNPARARELEQLRTQHGQLRPRDYWRLSFLACWTAGSMGHYLARVADWWGDVPVRDVGLLASEGRVTIPFEDGTPAGVLDLPGALFEFIPLEQADAAQPQTLLADELTVGERYIVVLTNSTGLLRYRLDDVVRVTGMRFDTPLLEFLHRAGRVSSVAGEKLTENQAVAAVIAACKRLGIPPFDFLLAPCWGDPPYYRLTATVALSATDVAEVDAALAEQNDEYASRRKSARLSGLTFRRASADAFERFERGLLAARRSAAEQFKRPCLLTECGSDDAFDRLAPVN